MAGWQGVSPTFPAQRELLYLRDLSSVCKHTQQEHHEQDERWLGRYVELLVSPSFTAHLVLHEMGLTSNEKDTINDDEKIKAWSKGRRKEKRFHGHIDGASESPAKSVCKNSLRRDEER